MPPDVRGFSATFADFKLVKTRSVAQFVLEVPIEQANAALAALGGLPQPKDEQWVAVVPLTQEAAQRGAEKPRKPKSRAEMAGILCNDPRFWAYLNNETRGVHRWTAFDAAGAADGVREYCGVASRSELNTNPAAAAKWEELANGFRAYIGQSGGPER